MRLLNGELGGWTIRASVIPLGLRQVLAVFCIAEKNGGAGAKHTVVFEPERGRGLDEQAIAMANRLLSKRF